MSALNKKVLVVDDDPVVSKSMDRVLSDRGYLVITAHDGEDAMAKLANDEYDVVFTDIRMPGMDGIEVAKQVKTRRPWVPVVIITGYGTANNEARAKEVGVNSFLRKPLSPEMIEDSARDALLEKEKAISLAQVRVEPLVPTFEVPVTPANEEHVEKHNVLKDLAMLLLAPFIGLLYVVALPVVGLAALAWMALSSYGEHAARTGAHGTLHNVIMLVAAPFIGLVYVLVLPVVGLLTMAWMSLSGKHE